ncbi:hypothetical protein SOVF_037680 isoform A [Spinacia oleracea]|nr:hypothetical protein SOVF_037680 isoform A [Spinacia oleracea]
MIDYFAKFFKLPFLEPYLKKDGDFSHGANFAVAGATAMNCSTLAKDDIKNCPIKSSLLVQLDWFESHLHSICSTVSECRERLAKSLILMGEIGGNDYNWALSQRNSMDEIYKMVPGVVHVIKMAIQETFQSVV